MAEPFLGEIRPFSFNFAPHGWALCNGQLLQISQHQALYTLLGTVYGGDGKTTFGLPNLQGRSPIPLSNQITLGQAGGEEGHVLTISEIPSHVHQATGGSNALSTAAIGNVWGTLSTNSSYSPDTNAVLSSSALETTGGSQAHPNMQPYLVLNYCIALQGIWPPKN